MNASHNRTILQTTPLHDLHIELGARMMPFAGYDMPVQYPLGILGEHNHTRERAGLFDVSHMGQVRITGADPVAAMETLVPGDISALEVGGMRYSMLTNERGGILDDLMITRGEDHLLVVVNAGCKDLDIAHLKSRLGDDVVEVMDEWALLALQGPMAAEVMERHAPDAVDLIFMEAAAMEVSGATCFVSRSGYTGEDGFEISVPAADAEALARTLLADSDVSAIGLGARDSLRLEAGLCLYGHDIDETTTPVEAHLAWAVSKSRREKGGFPGAEVIVGQIVDGVARERVGLRPQSRVLAREGTEITDVSGKVVGRVTSGGFGPTAGGPIAMGYVEAGHHMPDSELQFIVRGKKYAAKVVKMPFVPHRYVK